MFINVFMTCTEKSQTVKGIRYFLEACKKQMIYLNVQFLSSGSNDLIPITDLIALTQQNGNFI